MAMVVAANESTPLIKEDGGGINNNSAGDVNHHHAQHLQLSGATYSDIHNNDNIGHSNDVANINNGHPTQKKEDEIVSTLASVAGNVLECYDFALYGYFSDIIGQKFFPPTNDESTAIIESFLVFGGAFLVRPVGGVVMGYVGDTFSRKRALEISIFMMALPTFAMGCLPTFSVVGWWAVVLLVFVRLLQGLSVGGQLMSSLVFVAEGHDRRWWGWYGSVSSV